MYYKKVEAQYFIRLEAGEEIIEKLKEFCEAEQIKLGYVQAIGAVNRAVIGFFELATREYKSTELLGDHEITGLTGSITEMEDKPYLHLHIMLAGSDNIVKGGHLNKAYVSVTCELIVTTIHGKVNRFRDRELDINLLDL